MVMMTVAFNAVVDGVADDDNHYDDGVNDDEDVKVALVVVVDDDDVTNSIIYVNVYIFLESTIPQYL